MTPKPRQSAMPTLDYQPPDPLDPDEADRRFQRQQLKIYALASLIALLFWAFVWRSFGGR